MRSCTSTIAFAAVVVALFLYAGVGSANADTVVYSQGFETDTAGWDVFGGALNATRVPSGTNAVPSAAGAFHGQVTTGATNWGGYSSVFPAGGYTTSVDVYLDLAAGTNDTRFDFSSAVNRPDGTHRRDFVFNGGFYDDSDVTGSGDRFVFSASNAAGRANSFPKNPGRDPFAVTSTGWYTFEHRFYDNAGVLAVDLNLKSGATLLHSWTLSDLTDLIGVTVGGNRYGYFAANEFSFLAIDNSTLITQDAAAVPLPLAAVGGLALIGGIGATRRRRATETLLA